MSAKDLSRFPEPKNKKEEKMDTKGLTRREFLRDAALAGAGLVAAACGPPTPPVAAPSPEIKEVEVTKVVKETVVTK